MFAMQVAVLRRRIEGMDERRAVRSVQREFARLYRKQQREALEEVGQLVLGGEA